MGGFRKVGLITCTALALANMIGTGVFTSLGFQVQAIPSPFLILLVWVLGGVVAFCGALSYAELAAALPRSGGEYNFLVGDLSSGHRFHGRLRFGRGRVLRADRSFGDSAGKVSCCGLCRGFLPGWVSVSAVLLLAAVHSLTVRASGNFQVVITSLKVGLICALSSELGSGLASHGHFRRAKEISA